MILHAADIEAFDARIRVVMLASVYMEANDADALVQLFTEDLEFVRPATYPDFATRGRTELHAVRLQTSIHTLHRENLTLNETD